jgi:hypothetical protein
MPLAIDHQVFGTRRCHLALPPHSYTDACQRARPTTTPVQNDMQGRNVPEGKSCKNWARHRFESGRCMAHRCFIIGEIRPCPAGAPLALKRKGRLRMVTHVYAASAIRMEQWLSNSPDFPIIGLFDMRLAAAAPKPPLSDNPRW